MHSSRSWLIWLVNAKRDLSLSLWSWRRTMSIKQGRLETCQITRNKSRVIIMEDSGVALAKKDRETETWPHPGPIRISWRINPGTKMAPGNIPATPRPLRFQSPPSASAAYIKTPPGSLPRRDLATQIHQAQHDLNSIPVHPSNASRLYV